MSRLTRSTTMICLVLLHAAPAHGQKPFWEKKTYRNPQGEQLAYRLFEPASRDLSKLYPLVVFLHGRNARGNDNESQLGAGTAQFAAADNQKKHPCFVVAPQCPGKEPFSFWNQTVRGGLVLGMIKDVAKRHPIDPGRIYVIGVSDGGWGVWELLLRHPDRFAAAVPICGRGDLDGAASFAKVPVWIFHGAKDKTEPVKSSRDMVAALKKAGGKPEYTEYADEGHNCWDRAYRDPKLFAWLFAQQHERPTPRPGPIVARRVVLMQHPARAHPLVAGRPVVGPTIPGLRGGQTAIPQGLAYWKKHNWFLISHYFEDETDASVVTALDARTGELMRCLTLVEVSGKAHTGHVGGLAISDKYLWIGSGPLLYRAPLAALEAAGRVDYLRLKQPFETECTASYVAYHDTRIWVGEFVWREQGIDGDPAHYLQDRDGARKYAWIAGYPLDEDEDPMGSSGGSLPPPRTVISVRQKVQGMAFLGDSIILSMSHGRTKNSTLAGYANPVKEKRHTKTEVHGETVSVWFLDGQNRAWERTDLPPMSEGITAVGDQFALIFESGAQRYQKGGHGPIDTILVFKNPR